MRTQNFLYLFVSFLLVGKLSTHATPITCYGMMTGDTLRIGNRVIERAFRWNGGNLITISLTDKHSGHQWKNEQEVPDFFVPQQSSLSTNASWKATEIISPLKPRCLEVTVQYMLDELQVKKVYLLYDDCPAIACCLYLKGKSRGSWMIHRTSSADQINLESQSVLKQKNEIPILDQLSLSGRHWGLTAIEFSDVTDYNNTLVFPRSALSYHENFYRGNLLFFENKEEDNGLFYLKESPCSSVQLAYPGADFITKFGQIQVIGLGLTANDLKADEWTAAYSFVIGCYAGGELNRLTALRTYQRNIRTLLNGRDEMIMMNTWGDRGQDARVNESFCLRELEGASRLGVTHFQIDDGWQEGRSPASIEGGSFMNIWQNPNFWKPDPVRYPNGLTPVVKRGRNLGIEVCLWFNPSFQNDYENWQKDADALIYLYRQYGIRTFKIDGLSIPNKLSEIRVRRLLDSVLEATNQQAVFNIDVTAGKRGGYFMFNEYGTLFLENRYTDWVNYYPYWTLRNLWMLSKYVPTERLQIEFLNKWRNWEKYGDDPFAPANYSFDYLFAITLPAQPLAWFEATALPAEAFALQKQIAIYRKIQHGFHQGLIFPIGEEPSGKSWTGFQSIGQAKGYLILFREDNAMECADIQVYMEPGCKVNLVPLLGTGKGMEQQVSATRTLHFALPQKNSYVLYEYEINDRLIPECYDRLK